MTYKTYNEALEALTTDQIISIIESDFLTTSIENLPIVYKIAYDTSMEDTEPEQLISNLESLNIDLLQTIDTEDLVIMLIVGCELQSTLEYECYDEDTYNSKLDEGAKVIAESIIEEDNISEYLRYYIDMECLTKDIYTYSSDSELLRIEEVPGSVTIADTTYYVYRD